MAQARERLQDIVQRIGTGWPVVDEVSGGLPMARTTLVRGPGLLRRQLLSRTAAWAAGEGYPTLIASRTMTTEELWLAIGAAGLGLPPEALLTISAHDAWIDDRMRVLDLRVHGGPDAPAHVARDLEQRVPSLLIIDDYGTWEEDWPPALDPAERRMDYELFPRRLGCAFVLGTATMDGFSTDLERVRLTLRLQVDDDGRRATISAYERFAKRHRTILMRDGWLETRLTDRPMIRRPGVTNIWQDRGEAQIDSFASTLGAEVEDQQW